MKFDDKALDQFGLIFSDCGIRGIWGIFLFVPSGPIQECFGGLGFTSFKKPIVLVTCYI